MQVSGKKVGECGRNDTQSQPLPKTRGRECRESKNGIEKAITDLYQTVAEREGNLITIRHSHIEMMK